VRQLSFQNYAISNSEVLCFQNCRRKWSYEFALRLTPKNQAPALHRGIVGHEVLEAYYGRLLNGDSHYDAERAGLSLLDHKIVETLTAGNDANILMALRDTLVSYFGVAQEDDWQILAVEKDFIVEVDGIPIGMRLDLFARPRTGKWAGENLLIDHKFSYQDWSDKDVDMAGQPYKYTYIMQKNGIKVDRVVYNIIKYRTPKDILSRKSLVIKPVEAAVAIRDHVTIAKEIQAYRDRILDDHEAGNDNWRDEMPRVMDKYKCGMCSFAPICKAEMSGRNTATEKMLDLEYRANDYGYELAGEQ
jgi:CRISPR/Cas system-associated exonuclease Cas4 (RecB family)